MKTIVPARKIRVALQVFAPEPVALKTEGIDRWRLQYGVRAGKSRIGFWSYPWGQTRRIQIGGSSLVCVTVSAARQE